MCNKSLQQYKKIMQSFEQFNFLSIKNLIDICISHLSRQNIFQEQKNKIQILFRELSFSF